MLNFEYKGISQNKYVEGEIEALNNEPGVRSARYSSEEKDPLKNIELVLKKLEGISNRKARFRTVISLIYNDKKRLYINEKR